MNNAPGLPAAEAIIAATRNWLEKAVIGLNLCPFAKAVHIKERIRFAVCDARATDALLHALIDELRRLQDADINVCETTLLIHPFVLNDFAAYNNFLDVADVTVQTAGLAGKIQIASFHPDYQFADTATDGIENFTNRSPYPMLHLLREDSIARAMTAIHDASVIYENNINTLRQLGLEGWRRLWVNPTA